MKRVVIFCAGLPVVWFVFVSIWGSILETKDRKNLIYPYGGLGYLDRRLKQADTIRNVDLLILGSSHVYRGIDPRILRRHGIKSFNLGSSIQSPIQTLYLLKKYLSEMNPRIVVFEVGYKTFSSDGVESAVDILSNTEDFDADLFEMVFSVNEVVVYNSMAFSFFRKKILGKKDNDFVLEGETYVSGGFVEKADGEYNGPEVFARAPKPLEEKQKAAFEACMRFLSDHNVKVILIQTPILYDYYQSIDNKDEYNAYFIQHATTYINFSDSAYTDKAFFYDHHHLNQKGVHRFNEALIRILNNEFPAGNKIETATAAK